MNLIAPVTNAATRVIVAATPAVKLVVVEYTKALAQTAAVATVVAVAYGAGALAYSGFHKVQDFRAKRATKPAPPVAPAEPKAAKKATPPVTPVVAPKPAKQAPARAPASNVPNGAATRSPPSATPRPRRRPAPSKQPIPQPAAA